MGKRGGSKLALVGRGEKKEKKKTGKSQTYPRHLAQRGKNVRRGGKRMYELKSQNASIQFNKRYDKDILGKKGKAKNRRTKRRVVVEQTLKPS